MLTVKNITKSFEGLRSLLKKSAKKKYVIENISFEAPCSSIIFINGPNGSGKTTLLKIISGYLLPDRGTVLFNNEIIKKSEVDYIDSSERSFFWRLTVKENLLFFSKVNNLHKNKILQIDDLLRLFNCLDLRDKEMMKLSSGEKQKIKLVRAFLKDPKIMLFDEVSNSLDEENKNQLYSKIKESIERGKLIIWTSHIKDEELILGCTKKINLEKS